MYKCATLMVLAVAMLGIAAIGCSANAGMVPVPFSFQGVPPEDIYFSGPALAPMGYAGFCVRYPADCTTPRSGIMFRGGPTRATVERMVELDRVNASVNRRIAPLVNERLGGKDWMISPTRGDCKDYAVTKRHELLRLGWPMRNLLLSEVILFGGEHHLVLVVRLKGGDVVLDNLNSEVRSWSQAAYRWVRMQTSSDPNNWVAVAD
jgi:predicted transglutaminase-like cysteine proteinase